MATAYNGRVKRALVAAVLLVGCSFTATNNGSDARGGGGGIDATVAGPDAGGAGSNGSGSQGSGEPGSGGSGIADAGVSDARDLDAAVDAAPPPCGGNGQACCATAPQCQGTIDVCLGGTCVVVAGKN